MLGTFNGTVPSDHGSVWTVELDTNDGATVLIGADARMAVGLVEAWVTDGPIDVEYEAWQVLG